jgi:hypothetical protein
VLGRPRLVQGFHDQRRKRAVSKIIHMEAAAEPTAPSAVAEAFYADAVRELSKLDIRFLLAGTYALSAYTGITRATKDLDVICKPADYPFVLNHFRRLGHEVAIEDERWLAKVFRDGQFFDLIFASWHGLMPVTDSWFEYALHMEILGVPVQVIAPTELIWSKAFVQLRHRYDGADIAHVILKQHDRIDWRRLLGYMELHWEVLLIHLLNFRWAYPSERACIPSWLMDDLVRRLWRQLELPPARIKICRGRILSPIDYAPAVREWGFVDVDEAG